MEEDDPFNSDAFNTPASDDSSDFPQTIDEAAATIATQMDPFQVTDTKINDMNDSNNLDDGSYTGDDSSDTGSSLGNWLDSLVSDITTAGKDVAKAAIDKAKQSATQSLGKGGSSTSTSKTTNTSTSKTTVLGMTPTTALIAALGVGLLVYFASRSRGAVTA